jgi:hypothetical protein
MLKLNHLQFQKRAVDFDKNEPCQKSLRGSKRRDNSLSSKPIKTEKKLSQIKTLEPIQPAQQI